MEEAPQQRPRQKQQRPRVMPGRDHRGVVSNEETPKNSLYGTAPPKETLGASTVFKSTEEHTLRKSYEGICHDDAARSETKGTKREEQGPRGGDKPNNQNVTRGWSPERP